MMAAKAKQKSATSAESGSHDEHGHHKLCAQPRTAPIALPQTVSQERALAIYLTNKKWVSGTVLHYCFINRASSPNWTWDERQKDVVRKAFKKWADVGIGLIFTEVNDPGEAEIRIGCEQNGRSWSYVGTDCLKYADLGRTMNFGWDLRTRWGGATALHEIGHALGLEHEHQNPNSGIVWNEPAVYDYYRGSPNYWDDDSIRHNVLEKIQSSRLRGSNWDPGSNMQYPVLPGLMVAPKPYDKNGVPENYELSHTDKVVILEDYPPVSGRREIAVMHLEPLPTDSGAQTSFTFSPKMTRKYKVQTLGASDTRLVVFEERNNEPRHHDAADDSGLSENNVIETKLIAGRKYIISVRTNFVSAPDGLGLLVS